MRTSKEWESFLRSQAKHGRPDDIEVQFIADLAAMEKLAIGGDGTTHWYYKDQYEAKERECEGAWYQRDQYKERAEKAEQDAKDEKEMHWKWRDATIAAEVLIAELEAFIKPITDAYNTNGTDGVTRTLDGAKEGKR